MTIEFGNIGTKRIDKDGSESYMDGGYTSETAAKRSIPTYNAHLGESSLPVTFQIVTNNETYTNEKVLQSSVRTKENNGKRFKWEKITDS